jgi:hypothetical protein
MSKKAKQPEVHETALSSAVTPETERPSFLAERGKKGLETINKVVTPPSITIVQAMSDKLLEAGFEPGNVVLMPAAELGPDTITVTPLYFFTVYQCINPRELKDLRMVREESFDDMSEIAAKCQAMVEFPCPENEKYTCYYQQTLIFVVWVEELKMPIALRFYRSEYKTGKLFAAKIKARNASIFAGRYVLQIGVHKNEKGRWFGWDFKPAENPWVSEEEYINFEEIHDELARAHSSGILRPADVELDSDVDGTDGASSVGM